MESTLYSIGHGNKDKNEFLQELLSFDISYLVDIRTHPYSKWNPDFNKDSLKDFLSDNGIIYVYMGKELGGLPQDTSCYSLGGHVDYTKLRENEDFIKGLNRLVVADRKRIKLAIMCSETDPSQCHRSKLIGQELLKIGIVLNHIVGIGKSETQYKVLKKLTNGQMSLFGGPETETFASRNTYTVQR